MIKADFDVVNPEAVMLRMTISAKAGTWMKLRKALKAAQQDQWSNDTQEMMDAIQSGLDAVERGFFGLGANSDE